MDEDTEMAALAHQQQLEMRWAHELDEDPAYIEWFEQLAAEAASRTETNNGNHSI